ncbi:MAG: hypothetical protein M1825_005884 [Sarcosagium campestre]|nr:MAG: hypothetical protein M1825_005884 [Sarcosagium campestre]
MFSAPPHLQTRRPSPTTVEYVLSTRPSQFTLIARLLFALTTLLRLLTGSLVLLVNYCKWATHAVRQPTANELKLLDSRLGLLIGRFGAWLPWWQVLAISLVVGYVVFRRGYTEESLLVVRGLGIQTSTSSTTYLSTSMTRFIPTNLIQDIFIHEAFKNFEVRFYLAVVVHEEEDVVVVFPLVA